MTDHIDRLDGEMFGDYLIDKRIAVGRMSYIYLARSPQGRQVALKILHPRAAQRDQFREKFRAESRLSRDLRHPNLVRVHGGGSVDGNLYIEMEYIPDGTLRDHLSGPRSKRLDIDSVLTVAEQISSALQVVHDHELIHREVAPENILVRLSPDGEGVVHAYLTGLGMPRDFTVSLGAEDPLGTRRCSAPELYLDRPASDATDVYSLGCVVYECLAGVPAFADEDFEVLKDSILSDAPRPLVDINPHVRLEVADVVHQALAKDAMRRQISPIDFSNALKDAVDWKVGPESPETAEPPEVSVPPGEHQRGQPGGYWRWLALRGSAAAIVLVALGIGAYYVLNPHPSNTRGATTHQLTGSLGRAVNRMLNFGGHTPQNLAHCTQRSPSGAITCSTATYSFPPLRPIRNVSFHFTQPSPAFFTTSLGTALSAAKVDHDFTGSYRGVCLNHSPSQWHNEDDWFHMVPPGTNEAQDGVHHMQGKFKMAARMTTMEKSMAGDEGTILCYTNPGSHQWVIVWTETPFMTVGTNRFIGRVTATSQADAFHAWFASHHELMPEP